MPTELRRKPTEFSPGGGWAVPYTPNAPYLPPTTAIRDLSQAILTGLSSHNLSLPTLILEPGRELVARAGVALYTVGALKQADQVRYAFLDGGLADNPRPALYGANYHALLANRNGTKRQSMASTYNGNPRPAVLWLHEGKAQVVQRRETIEELWIRDRRLEIDNWGE